jgi:hypothetical protein
MRGKSIPRSVLKSGVKLPELSRNKSCSIPSDLNKSSFVVSSRGPTPQEELDACRPLLSLSDNLFIKKDRRKPSPVTKRHIDVEIRCEEKKVKEHSSPDHRERVRQELSAVLKRSSEFNGNGTSFSISPRQMLHQHQHSPSTRRIVSFSGTVHVEERDETSSEDEENLRVNDEADSSKRGRIVHQQPPKKEVKKDQQQDKGGYDIDDEEEAAVVVADGDVCRRCGNQVYPLEKLEPGPGQFYHERCFRCAVCKTKLSLATYCRSLQASNDPRVYCRPHQPRLDKVKVIRPKSCLELC